jgi:methionyl-tRNA formyltransferase
MNTVLLIGRGVSALTALESLAERFRVVGVIRDVRVSAGEEDEVQRRAREFNVPILTDISLQGVERAVTEYHPDCTVISTYDRILGSRVLDRSRFVNVHYSLLPTYRGRANVNWAIINGEPELAITIHAVTKDLDAGNILYQKRVAIGPDDTVGHIYSVLNDIQRTVLGGTLESYIGGYAGIPQDQSPATYGCRRIPQDGEIDWAAPTERIYALIRALSPPFPGAYTYLEMRRISIVRAEPVKEALRYVGRVPGRVVGRHSDRGYVDVLSGDGVLRIHEVMTDDSVVRPASAVVRSTAQTLGLRAAELLERIDALSRQIEMPGGKSQSSDLTHVGRGNHATIREMEQESGLNSRRHGGAPCRRAHDHRR